MAKEFSFSEEKQDTPGNRNKNTEKGLTRLFIKWGIAKTPAQANLYFVGIIIVCMGLIVYFNI